MNSQNTVRPTNHSKDFSKFLSRSVSILGLIYLICIPFGPVKKESRFDPVDVGVLMVLFIANTDIIERIKEIKLGKDGFEATIEKVEEVSKNVANIFDQNQIDFEAMRYMDLQLSDATPLSDSNDLREKILQASPIAVEYIYQRAKDVRHDLARENRHRKAQGQPTIKGMLERMIPLFQALTESKYGQEFHRYHAQLGYALKDHALEDDDAPKISELSDARNSLNQAIELWKQQHPHCKSLPALYCFNWAECEAALTDESSLTLIEIQWRVQSAALCKALEGEKLNKIKAAIAQKYGISFLASLHPLNAPCRSSTRLIG
ncbi:MAG TPA: hypothetical protein V6C78_18795 [Crinalium sp.]|jgi:hypothetical protein